MTIGLPAMKVGRLTELDAADGERPVLDGAVAFQLHDTYGFPIDLTRVIANEHDRTVDEDAAAAAVAEAQSGGGKDGPAGTGKAVDAVWFDLRDRLGETNFLGYDADEGDAKVVAIVQGGGPQRTRAATPGASAPLRPLQPRPWQAGTRSLPPSR